MGIMEGISASCNEKPTILLKSDTSTFNGRAKAAISGRIGSYEGAADEKLPYLVVGHMDCSGLAKESFGSLEG